MMFKPFPNNGFLPSTTPLPIIAVENIIMECHAKNVKEIGKLLIHQQRIGLIRQAVMPQVKINMHLTNHNPMAIPAARLIEARWS